MPQPYSRYSRILLHFTIQLFSPPWRTSFTALPRIFLVYHSTSGI